MDYSFISLTSDLRALTSLARRSLVRRRLAFVLAHHRNEQVGDARRPNVAQRAKLVAIDMTSARWSCATMPLDNSRTLLVRLIVVFARKLSAFARSNFGCTPAT